MLEPVRLVRHIIRDGFYFITSCIFNVQFLCNDKYYHHEDVVAMGSPFDPRFADIIAKRETKHYAKLAVYLRTFSAILIS